MLEKQANMEFKKMERSSQTPPGWRLATVKEAQQRSSILKKTGIIHEKDRVRLLDGWILGKGYYAGWNYAAPVLFGTSGGSQEPERDETLLTIRVGYRACLGYMLLLHSPTLHISGSDDRNASLYSDVPELSQEGKCAAFLLSCEDWNHDVLHCLLPALVTKADDSTKAVSEVVSAIAREWQHVFVPRNENFERSFEALKVYIGKCLEDLTINKQNSDQRKIIDEILQELDLTPYRRMFHDFEPEKVAENMFHKLRIVVIESVAWRTFYILCSKLYDNVIIHSDPSIADLIHYAYSFLGETTKEGTANAVKEINGNVKQFDEILGFTMSSCKGKPDVLGNCLLLAAFRNDANVVEQLIQRGVQLTARDYLSGFTALHAAVRNDDFEMAERLLTEEESLANTADYRNLFTPLHMVTCCPLELGPSIEICALLVRGDAYLALTWTSVTLTDSPHLSTSLQLLGTMMANSTFSTPSL